MEIKALVENWLPDAIVLIQTDGNDACLSIIPEDRAVQFPKRDYKKSLSVMMDCQRLSGLLADIQEALGYCADSDPNKQFQIHIAPNGERNVCLVNHRVHSKDAVQ
jgi:hypothetical protein